MTVNLIIIIFTCIISYYGLNNRTIQDRLKHYPFQEHRDKSFSRLLTAGFLHGSYIHLGINMFVLYMFGNFVENRLNLIYDPLIGKVIYFILYIVIIVFANIPTFMKHKNNSSFASIGASGAVSGIIFIYIALNPWQPIYLYGIIPIYSILAGIAYLIYSSWASKNKRDHIDHDAHFFGALFGIVGMIVLDRELITNFLDKITDVPFL